MLRHAHWTSWLVLPAFFVAALLLLRDRQLLPRSPVRSFILPGFDTLKLAASPIIQRVSIATLIGVPVLIFFWPICESHLQTFRSLQFPLELKYTYFASWLLSFAGLLVPLGRPQPEPVPDTIAAIVRATVLFFVSTAGLLLLAVLIQNGFDVYRFNAPRSENPHNSNRTDQHLNVSAGIEAVQKLLQGRTWMKENRGLPPSYTPASVEGGLAEPLR